MSDEKNIIDNYSTSVQAVRSIVTNADVERNEHLTYEAVTIGGKVLAVTIHPHPHWAPTNETRVMDQVHDALNDTGKYKAVWTKNKTGMLIVTKNV